MTMKNKKPIIGMKFGRLLALHEVGKGNRGYIYSFQCDCGNTKELPASSVRTGKVLSCGCLRSETTKAKNFVHGLIHTGSYKSWSAMKSRCNNKNQKSNQRYGLLGYDKSWELFENFVADMGERPIGMTLDRIDNSKGYSKENCRWATPSQQNRNTKQNVFITHNGKTLCMKDWSIETGIPYPTIQDRVKRNKTPAEILEIANV
jgi:hypothetical protein